MTLKEFQRYLKGVPKALNEHIVKGIQTGAQRAIAIAVAEGDAAPPASQRGSIGAFNTGRYHRSWHVENVADGAVVSNIAPYADVIERGRRPGRRQPRTETIVQWARQRLGLDEKKARQAAFPIARAIGRRGLRARRVLSSARPKMIAAVLEEVKASIAEALKGAV